MRDSHLSYRSIEDLKPTPNNPRTHSRAQIKQIERSMREFGFINPVVVDQQGNVVAGHGRLEAAKNLGIQEVPTVEVRHLSPRQLRAYLIADNKLAEGAGWDEGLLKMQLTQLADEGFDPTLTGFSMGELDKIVLDAAAAAGEIRLPAADPAKPSVSQLGDLWRIGDHAVLCGDSTRLASYESLMGNESAGLVFTDPPYNVPIAGHVSGLGQVTHREFAMASGEMSREQFTAFLSRIFDQLALFSRDGSLHYICMDWRHMREVLEGAEGPYTELKNLCVWAKTNGGMGNLYRSRHELVFVYKNGSQPNLNNVQLGKNGRNRTNVWDYAGANAFSTTREDDLAMHPTVKPVRLVADAILDASNRGDIVLDAFGGSGTTLVAAEETKRRGRAIEIDPIYVDTIVKRMERATGEKAMLAISGRTFDEVVEQRRFLN